MGTSKETLLLVNLPPLMGATGLLDAPSILSDANPPISELDSGKAKKERENR